MGSMVGHVLAVESGGNRLWKPFLITQNCKIDPLQKSTFVWILQSTRPHLSYTAMIVC